MVYREGPMKGGTGNLTQGGENEGGPAQEGIRRTCGGCSSVHPPGGVRENGRIVAASWGRRVRGYW